MKLAFAVLAAVGLFSASAAAQPFAINWYTIDGGGGTSSGGTFTLNGTIGQHDAQQGMSGGTFTLDSGFWAGVGLPPPCPADINGDGFLDNGDIAAYIALFLGGNLLADFNGDGFLDNGDIGDFIAAFLVGC